MTEEAAVNLGQRQNTLNLPLRFGIKKPCLVSERTFDDGLPSRTVEKSGSRNREITNSSHRFAWCGSSKCTDGISVQMELPRSS